MCDNASTIALENNPIHHARSKHIEIDCHFVRDKVKQGQITPYFFPSKFQVADMLTKGLSRTLHFNCLSKLGICDPYTMPICKGDNVNTARISNNGVMPNTPSSQEDENAAQVQSLQRKATPPKMKLLLNQCLIQCNSM